MTEKKFTILNVLDGTISNFWQFCRAWKVWSIYSLAFFLMSVICANWSHTCKDSLSISWWCPQSSNVYFIYARVIFYYIGILFLIFSFAYDICKEVLNGNKSGFKALFLLNKTKLKSMGLLFALCLAFFTALGICVWQIFRAANPNWLIEFGYFLIVFVLATFVVLLLRTSASFGFILTEAKWPDFKKLFNLTCGKFYVVLITFCVMTYAVNLLQMKLRGLLDYWNMEMINYPVVLTSEFLGSIIQIATLGIYVAYFLALSQVLKSNEQK